MTWCWWCKDCPALQGGGTRRSMRKNAKTHSRTAKHITRFGELETAKVHETFSLKAEPAT